MVELVHIYFCSKSKEHIWGKTDFIKHVAYDMADATKFGDSMNIAKKSQARVHACNSNI